MIRIDLRADVKPALAALAQLSDGVRGRALARALNRTATTVRAEARRAIGRRYTLPSARINTVLRIRHANVANAEAAVFAKDTRIPLAAFAARARKKSGDITVKVLRAGARQTVTGNPRMASRPFIATVGAGHVGIFQRVSDARFPIRELFSVSIASALTSKVISDALDKVARKRFALELEREVRFRLKVAT